MRKAVSEMLLTLLLLSILVLTLAFSVQPLRADPPKNTVGENYPTIPEAIKYSMLGDTIGNTYDRLAAYAYAQKYWDEVCSDGYFWDTPSTYVSLEPGTNITSMTGYDCAHFVSCCIGNEPHEQGGGLDVPSRVPPTYGEPGAARLGDWLIGSGNGVERTSTTELDKGDVINYDWDGDEHWDHVALYLENDEVAAHTECVWKEDWRLGGAENYRFIHIVSSPPATTLWSYPTGGAILDVKDIPDVNGDGKPDVVAGSTDNNVYVLDGTTGSRIWSKLTGADVVSVNYIHDITDDDVPEIICGSSDGNVYLFNGTGGDVIWAEPINPPNPPIYRVLGIEDVTGDGKPDVIAGGTEGDWTIIECKVGNNGTKKWFNDEYDAIGHRADFTVLKDVTGDGKQDVIWAYGAYSSSIALINGESGVRQKKIGVDRNTWGTMLVTVPDVSGDGYEDVVNTRTEKGFSRGARTYLLSGPTLEEIWRIQKPAHDPDERMWDANYISDISADGRAEIILGWKDKVFCLNGVNGIEIWNSTVTDGNTQYTRSHRITEGRDISGDGVDDIVVGVQNGMVYFLSGEDGTWILHPYQIGGPVNSVAYLEDVTGDSFPEILVGGADHIIYCLTSVLPPSQTMVFFNIGPNPAEAGQTITLKGVLIDYNYNLLPNETVKLYARPLAGFWIYLTSLTTNKYGIFTWQATIPHALPPGIFVFAVYYPGSGRYESCYNFDVLAIQ